MTDSSTLAPVLHSSRVKQVRITDKIYTTEKWIYLIFRNSGTKGFKVFFKWKPMSKITIFSENTFLNKKSKSQLQIVLKNVLHGLCSLISSFLVSSLVLRLMLESSVESFQNTHTQWTRVGKGGRCIKKSHLWF